MSPELTTHPGELKLRALLAGEPVPAEIREHAAGCETCQGRVRELGEEQRRFEAEVPFERFAAGVERAQRTPRQLARPTRTLTRVGLALAAGLAVAVGVQLLRDDGGGNRLKGGAGIDVVVGGGAQRQASENPVTPEALAPGERVRIGLRADRWEYGIVVSIDDAGAVSPIYADAGRSLRLRGGESLEYLPDSLEFTGQGLERVIVVLTHEPLSLEEVTIAAQARYDEAHGDLLKLAPLEVPGEQFHRTFLKP